MFGRHRVVKAIKKGDMAQLKQILTDEPDLIHQKLKWELWAGEISILHMAAAYNQPEMVKFLVTDKRLEIDRWNRNNTPLHYAIIYRAFPAVKMLLSMGANTSWRDSNENTPNDYCKKRKYRELKELLRAAREERLLARQEEDRQRQEEACRQAAATEQEAAARVAGKWERVAEDRNKIVLVQDLPAQCLSLTELFDFAAERRTIVSRDLRSGQMSAPTILPFSQMSADRSMIEKARAELDRQWRAVDQADAGASDDAVVPEEESRRTEPRVAELARQRFI